MRSARFLSVVLVVGIGAMACGDGGSGGLENTGGSGGPSNGCTPSSRPGTIHGSCVIATWMCQDYSGSAYKDGVAGKAACEAMSGAYSNDPCEISASNYLGGCLTVCGQAAELTTRFFDDGSMFANVEVQRDVCAERKDTWLEP